MMIVICILTFTMLATMKNTLGPQVQFKSLSRRKGRRKMKEEGDELTSFLLVSYSREKWVLKRERQRKRKGLFELILKNSFIVFMFFENKKICLAHVFSSCFQETISKNQDLKNRKPKTHLSCFPCFCSLIF